MTELFLAENMKHEVTDFFSQILSPIYRFLRRIQFFQES